MEVEDSRIFSSPCRWINQPFTSLRVLAEAQWLEERSTTVEHVVIAISASFGGLRAMQ